MKFRPRPIGIAVILFAQMLPHFGMRVVQSVFGLFLVGIGLVQGTARKDL